MHNWTPPTLRLISAPIFPFSYATMLDEAEREGGGAGAERLVFLGPRYIYRHLAHFLDRIVQVFPIHRGLRSFSTLITMNRLTTYMFVAAGLMLSGSSAHAAQIPPELSQYFHTKENLIASFANGTYKITQPAQLIPQAGTSFLPEVNWSETHGLQIRRRSPRSPCPTSMFLRLISCSWLTPRTTRPFQQTRHYTR